MSFIYQTTNGTPNGTLSAIVEEEEDWNIHTDFCDWDIQGSSHAVRLAAEAETVTGRPHLAVDREGGCSPRFSVVPIPTVGTPVSYTFNGDAYPDGFVTHVTKKTGRVVKTSTGSVYYRRKTTDTWMKKGGTWFMCFGHVSERNREF